MALYWPDEKVALDIVDDPARRPFEGDESYTVLRVTCADLCNYDSYHKIMARLCELLGREMPSMPGWEDKNRELHELLSREVFGNNYEGFSAQKADDAEGLAGMFADDTLANVQILASSKQEADRMRDAARENGQYVRGISVWEGPVPKGSFETISDNLRMSTPEYFFLRKANQLSLVEAVSLGIELCGKFRTVVTQYNRGEDYDFLRSPRTSKGRIRAYLRGARGTKEGKRAKRVLRLVADECCSPMSSYLYVLLCLPRAQGSYGVERGIMSGAFEGRRGFMPASYGKFLAYDLSWPDKHVAVQYTGPKQPGETQMEALQTEGMRVLCVTDDDIADPDRFDKTARKLADLLGMLMPEQTDKWLEARGRLRELLPPPAFHHMRLTMGDISHHDMS